MAEKIPVISIAGPTASGKTRLAVEIAKRLDGEIISADSMQIYKGCDIATAKPDFEEMQGIAHHLIDFLDIGENFSVSDYVKLARNAVNDIFSRGKQPIVAGGTGLYIDSLLNNIEFTKAETDFELRDTLMKRVQSEGAENLLHELRGIDPETAARLHTGDIKRIVRALEVYYTSGVTLSEQNFLSRLSETPYDALCIGLTAENREYLYERINRRVDIMLEKGLLQEARAFFKSDNAKTAKQAIGYKEMLPYIQGGATLCECVENLKRQTRRYAKRQLTWLRKNEKINWIYIDRCGGENAVVKEALKIIGER